MGYSLVEPFGQPRSDDGHRLLAALLFNANRGEGNRPLAPADFLAVWHDPEAAEAARIAALQAWAAGDPPAP